MLHIAASQGNSRMVHPGLLEFSPGMVCYQGGPCQVIKLHKIRKQVITSGCMQVCVCVCVDTNNIDIPSSSGDRCARLVVPESFFAAPHLLLRQLFLQHGADVNLEEETTQRTALHEALSLTKQQHRTPDEGAA